MASAISSAISDADTAVMARCSKYERVRVFGVLVSDGGVDLTGLGVLETKRERRKPRRKMPS